MSEYFFVSVNIYWCQSGYTEKSGVMPDWFLARITGCGSWECFLFMVRYSVFWQFPGS